MAVCSAFEMLSAAGPGVVAMNQAQLRRNRRAMHLVVVGMCRELLVNVPDSPMLCSVMLIYGNYRLIEPSCLYDCLQLVHCSLQVIWSFEDTYYPSQAIENKCTVICQYVGGEKIQ